jgi:hypothetical protein
MLVATMATSAAAYNQVSVSGFVDSASYAEYPYDKGLVPDGAGYLWYPESEELAFAPDGYQCPDFSLRESSLNGDYTQTAIMEHGHPVYSREVNGETWYLYYDAYQRYTRSSYVNIDGTSTTIYEGESYGWAIGKSIGRRCISFPTNYPETCGEKYCCPNELEAQSWCCINDNNNCVDPLVKMTKKEIHDGSASVCMPSGGTVGLDGLSGAQDWTVFTLGRPFYGEGDYKNGYSYGPGAYVWNCYAERQPYVMEGTSAISFQFDTVETTTTQAPTTTTQAPTTCQNPSSCQYNDCCAGSSCEVKTTGRKNKRVTTYTCKVDPTTTTQGPTSATKEPTTDTTAPPTSCSSYSTGNDCSAAGCNWHKRHGCS